MLRRPLPQHIQKTTRALLKDAAQRGARILDASVFFGFAPVAGIDSSYTVDATSREFLGDRRDRQYLFIANMGVNPIRISFGKPVTAATGIVLTTTGDFYEPLRPLSTSLNALSVLGSTLLVIEG